MLPASLSFEGGEGGGTEREKKTFWSDLSTKNVVFYGLTCQRENAKDLTPEESVIWHHMACIQD